MNELNPMAYAHKVIDAQQEVIFLMCQALEDINAECTKAMDEASRILDEVAKMGRSLCNDREEEDE